ncbi:nucleobase:cation symporter-2 family protein [Enterococcus alishanensis]|uniref:Purine permease n=1 Tax=Enterococcus alishanensis TaxID=1303817 RepID=A0ABS6T9V3_9ENTE|nr:nucleobase:cation symporter-2 family protein [Enterococcus alishanensis]MBV7389686.1 purine permease [Enterococcus alishanensis]
MAEPKETILVSEKTNALFDYDAVPSLIEVVPLGLQHVIAAVVGIVTPGLMIAQACNLSASDTTLIIQTSLIFAGVATLIQLFPVFRYFGARLPVMMGASFAYVPVLITMGANYGIATIFGSQIFGGLAVIFIGLVIKKIRVFFPPIVTGTVILSIGMSLFPVAVGYMAGGVSSSEYGSMKNWLVAIITFIIVFYLNSFGKGFLKLSSILVGMVVGYLISLPLGMVSFESVKEAGMFQMIRPLHFGLNFNFVQIFTLILLIFVDTVQAIGQFTATTVGAMDRQPTDRELSGGILGKGLAVFLGGFFGGVPISTFGQNVGLVISTKAINKYILTFTSAILIIAGFVPKIASLLTSIPYAVIGGATISVFATIALTGIQTIANEKLTSQNATIVGLSLALGTGVALSANSLQGFPEWFQTIFGESEVILTAIMAILLNIIFNRPKLKK